MASRRGERGGGSSGISTGSLDGPGTTFLDLSALSRGWEGWEGSGDALAKVEIKEKYGN